MFLGHVLNHLDRFAAQYTSQWAIVVAVTANLQGEAAAWAADLFSDHAGELADIGSFLDALIARFEDSTRVQRAEAEIVGLKQAGRPIREFIREFQRMAGHLRTWPERLLVHHFRNGLDKELRQACIMRGVPCRLHDWYKVVTELHTGLQELRSGMGDPAPFQQAGGKPKDVGDQFRVAVPAATRGTFQCFRCNKSGHRAAQCPMSMGKGSSPGLAVPTVQRRQDVTPPWGADQSRALRQTKEGTPY
ncbi:hypothetical protein NXF25_006537 [Crotalus adamanteus]|uniref:CCHC-type domain-containing protein n=1 Tax=Crotalus adamanteus TaxID=8729 RepID=A0AAW1C227_CROAD